MVYCLDIEERIINREDGASRITEDVLHFVLLHQIHKDLRPSHAYVLVSGVGLALGKKGTESS